MSIEALIQAHTEALLANTEAVKLLTLSLAGRTPAKEDKKQRTPIEITQSPDATVKIREGVTDKDVVDAMVEQSKERMEKAKAKADEETAVPYETVRALVLKLAPMQRDAIKALNAKHGIANLKVLLDKEDDFSTVNDQAKLEAVYADLQALEG